MPVNDWKTFEKNNPAFAFNVLYTKEMKACPIYIAKVN